MPLVAAQAHPDVRAKGLPRLLLVRIQRPALVVHQRPVFPRPVREDRALEELLGSFLLIWPESTA